MDLRWPDSGSLLDSLFSDAGHADMSESGSLSGVTLAQLDEALAAMQRGDVEYVILEDGPRFLQAAGDADGPYQVQVTEDGETFHDVEGGADATTVQQVMRAYLRGDTAWRDARWVPPLQS